MVVQLLIIYLKIDATRVVTLLIDACSITIHSAHSSLLVTNHNYLSFDIIFCDDNDDEFDRFTTTVHSLVILKFINVSKI